MKTRLKELIDSSQTIFTSEDLAKIWKIENPAYLRVVANRLNKRREIVRLQRGIYAINQDYDKLELANKLKAPSYVSMETVLQKKSVVFQKYGQVIFSVSNNTVNKEVDGTRFEYSKIATEILSDPLGVEIQSGVYAASLERAVCDRIYLSPNYFFDNLRPIDPQKLQLISLIYNKRVQREAQKLIKKIYADR